MQKKFSKHSLQGMLVFDGSHCRHEESGLSYASPLEIAYTPKGQIADAYILEKLEWDQKKKASTVVSNDKHLCREARALGAKTQSNETFLRYLEKKKASGRKHPPEPKDSPQNIERLLKIFEAELGE